MLIVHSGFALHKKLSESVNIDKYILFCSCVLEPPGEASLPVAGYPVPLHRLLAAERGEGAAYALAGGHLHQGGQRVRDGSQAPASPRHKQLNTLSVVECCSIKWRAFLYFFLFFIFFIFLFFCLLDFS
jgi:hypothetical protein